MRIVSIFLIFLFLSACASKEQKSSESTTDILSDTALTSEENNSNVDKEAADKQSETFVNRSTNQLENFSGITNFQPAKSIKDLSIRNFVTRLDQPDSTFADSDSLCPVGQLHFWNLEGQNCRIFALGDDYTQNANLRASCRVYGIQLAEGAESADYASFLGIKLGDESKQVEDKLGEFVKSNPAYQFEKLKGESILEKFLTKKQKSVFVLTDGKRYIHFAIGKKQKLNYILFANMEVRSAC
ncbi:hypothetical protein QNI16_25520 [Cytophagaceae bacterium YF14B1]|uniref:Lipoprotein n=1 Tax=Xanthocytophaga flava TaxID=3048013 RepID=A0AAE3U8C8_9BACT|nr:hypothetical protein [Xanthocytophaga flavus]MDJ1483884.1 hypothetical protein [Xanthocytophaga flavus]